MLDSQRAAIQRRRQVQRRRQEVVGPDQSNTVFYRGRDGETGHDLVERDGQVVPVFITGNAQPTRGMALKLLDGVRQGLALVLGPSREEVRRRPVTLQLISTLKAIVLFFKSQTPQPPTFGDVTLEFDPDQSVAEFVEGWDLAGFPGSPHQDVTGAVQYGLPILNLAFAMTGVCRHTTSGGLFVRLNFSAPPGAQIGSQTTASFQFAFESGTSIRSTNLNPATAASFNNVSTADTLNYSDLEPNPSSWLFQSSAIAPLRATNNQIAIAARGAEFLTAGEAEVSFRLTITIALAIDALPAEQTQSLSEIWLGGDRASLQIGEIDNVAESPAGIVTLNASATGVPAISQELTIPSSAGGTINNGNDGTVEYAGSATQNSLLLSGFGSAPAIPFENDAGAAGWSHNLSAQLVTLPPGIYRFTGAYFASLTGDFSQTRRLFVDPQGNDINTAQGTPSASFSLGGLGAVSFYDPGLIEDDSGSYADRSGPFDTVVSRFINFTITAVAEIGRRPTRVDGRNRDENIGTFGGGLAWSVSWDLRITSVPWGYLTYTPGFIYAFVRNSQVAKYFQITADGTITEAAYQRGEDILPAERDWRKSLAIFQPSGNSYPIDPNACYNTDRFNKFVSYSNLIEPDGPSVRRFELPLSANVDGNSLEEVLIAGQAIGEVTVAIANRTLTASNFCQFALQDSSTARVQEIVPVDEAQAITVEAIQVTE